MKRAKAFIFDLNGTMIDDMKYHIEAWYNMLHNELGAELPREEVKLHMYGKNSEVLDRIFGAGHFTNAEVDRISMEKERKYQEAFFPHLGMISGLPHFLEKAVAEQIALAIGSAAIPFNIDFVIDNLDIRRYFKAIVSADDVTHSKPDPETFLKAARLLGVAPEQCIVFEDAPKGVEAAHAAGMSCMVLTTMHSPDEFSRYPNVIACVRDYTDPACQQLLARELVLR